MRNLPYYLAVVALSVTMQMEAKAQSLEQLLEGKTVVYVGVCWFNKAGTLTFKRSDVKVTTDCVVGMTPDDQTLHYILVTKDNKAVKLVVYDEKTKKQKLLWSASGV